MAATTASVLRGPAPDVEQMTGFRSFAASQRGDLPRLCPVVFQRAADAVVSSVVANTLSRHPEQVDPHSRIRRVPADQGDHVLERRLVHPPPAIPVEVVLTFEDEENR